MQSIPAGTGTNASMDLADLIGGPVSQPIVNSTASIPASVGLPTMPGQFSSMPGVVSPASGKISANFNVESFFAIVFVLLLSR